jgi:hypothetical protein
MNAAIIAAHLPAGFAFKKEQLRDFCTAGAFERVLLEVFLAALQAHRCIINIRGMTVMRLPAQPVKRFTARFAIWHST